VLNAGLPGCNVLLLVPIPGLSSGNIGMVIVFFVGAFFLLLVFSLIGAAASSFESQIDLSMVARINSL
jgi:hypothetical protein